MNVRLQGRLPKVYPDMMRSQTLVGTKPYHFLPVPLSQVAA